MPHVAADVQKHARAAPGLHPALGEGYRGRAPPRRSPFARARRSSEYGLAIPPSFQKTTAPNSLIHRPLGIPRFDVDGMWQAWNFQEVVHSALIVNAEVANKPAIRGEPNGHPQECSSDAERARGHGAQCDGN